MQDVTREVSLAIRDRCYLTRSRSSSRESCAKPAAPSGMKVRERIQSGKSDDYTVELGCSLELVIMTDYVLIECAREAPVSMAAVEALQAKVQQPRPQHAMMLSTSGLRRMPCAPPEPWVCLARRGDGKTIRP